MADDQRDELGPTEGSLRWHLQHVRDSLVGTLDGLDEYDRRRPMTPSATNLLGLVKHRSQRRRACSILRCERAKKTHPITAATGAVAVEPASIHERLLGTTQPV